MAASAEAKHYVWDFASHVADDTAICRSNPTIRLDLSKQRLEYLRGVDTLRSDGLRVIWHDITDCGAWADFANLLHNFSSLATISFGEYVRVPRNVLLTAFASRPACKIDLLHS